MALTWQQLHASVHQLLDAARAAGASDAQLADGVMHVARNEELPPALAPHDTAIRHLAWLLLGRLPIVDPAASVAVKVSLGLTAGGQAPLTEVTELARASEQADQEQAAALDAEEAATRFYNRAVAFGEQGDTLSAIVDAGSALALDPADVQALMNRGTWRMQLQDVEGAMEDWTAAVEVDPSYALGWLKIGVVKLSCGMPEGADDVRRALDLAPPDWPFREQAEAWLRED